MNIPNYVMEIFDRSKFAIGYGEPGYTIEIEKRSIYQLQRSFESEINRFKNWIDKEYLSIIKANGGNELDVLNDCPICVINTIPHETHYRKQIATVTIYDPIMQKIEKYINNPIDNTQ